MTDRRSCRRAGPFTLRSFCDVRQMPLLVGVLQFLWGCIPALHMKSGRLYELFARMDLREEWGWMMVVSALYLIWASIVDRRESLNIAMFLCAVIWTTMSILYIHAWWLGVIQINGYSWISPVTMSAPVIACSLWVGLFREMILHPVAIPERRRQQQVG